MNYLILISHRDAPTPDDPEAWAKLSEEEQNQVFADWQEIRDNPKVTTGSRLEPPEMATTVRVEDGQTLTTDGPFVAVKEALNGWCILEADDLDEAIEFASKIPSARLGGAIEVRPVAQN